MFEKRKKDKKENNNNFSPSIKKFTEDNKKLGKYEKSIIKGMNKKTFNETIDKKKQIIIDYYDKQINEINEMSCKDFIITYLDLEKNKNIEKLMKVNLNQNFELGEASTKISNEINDIIEENEDDVDKEIKKRIDKIYERGKLSSVKNYIESKQEIKNFFPYEQKKFKRELKNKGNNEEKDIFYILQELTDLNTKIKEYKKENREKGSIIGIEQKENENVEEEEEINEEMELDE